MDTKNHNIRLAFIKLLGDRIEFEIQKPDDKIDFEIIEFCDQLLSDLMTATNISKKEMLVQIRLIKEQEKKLDLTE